MRRERRERLYVPPSFYVDGFNNVVIKSKGRGLGKRAKHACPVTPECARGTVCTIFVLTTVLFGVIIETAAAASRSSCCIRIKRKRKRTGVKSPTYPPSCPAGIHDLEISLFVQMRQCGSCNSRVDQHSPGGKRLCNIIADDVFDKNNKN